MPKSSTLVWEPHNETKLYNNKKIGQFGLSINHISTSDNDENLETFNGF
jgi:hypothetical protein